jgi:chromosome segregation ATPase
VRGNRLEAVARNQYKKTKHRAEKEKTMMTPNNVVEKVTLTLAEYNTMAKQIAELQEKQGLLEAQNKRLLKDFDEATDKLHRRNAQIADLKERIAKAQVNVDWKI